MINITKKDFIKHSVKPTERSVIIAEMYADDVTELPSADGIDGYELAQSSVAYVIKSGEIYILGGDGKWYDTDGKQAKE